MKVKKKNIIQIKKLIIVLIIKFNNPLLILRNEFLGTCSLMMVVIRNNQLRLISSFLEPT